MEASEPDELLGEPCCIRRSSSPSAGINRNKSDCRRDFPVRLPPEVSEAAELSPLLELSSLSQLLVMKSERAARLVPRSDILLLLLPLQSPEDVVAEGGASDKLRTLFDTPAAVRAAVGGVVGAGDARSIIAGLAGDNMLSLSGEDASQAATEMDVPVDGVA